MKKIAVSKIVVVLSLLMFCSVLLTQNSSATMQESTESKSAELKPTTPKQTVQNAAIKTPTDILLLVNEAKPQQIIVFDSNGEWLSGVQEVNVRIEISASGIKADCLSWKGILRPTNPNSFTASVKEIKSVSDVVFQEQLAKLNE